MTKRRGIISYDKLTVEQKKQILRDYPDGYINHLTSIKTPNGETLDALIWETDEVIYLVKIKQPAIKQVKDDDVEEDDFEDELDKNDLNDQDIDDAIVEENEEEEEYDKPTDDSDEDE
ncbi:MAG: hypothetical protein EBR24_08145 [Flavobacteriia bacterium]|nr:hypothetical protein [Flavobacteriia bacterium]